jgi:HEAT repeat protein
VLAHVLLHDQEPSIRVQAIDLLVQSKDAALAGFLQDLLRRENNTYIRSRSQRALAEMNASVGTF